jgi:Ni,Fe-hydrogenase maturation factor
MYSGTLSLFNELPRINNTDHLIIGDMLIKGGSPGHIVMICDEAINNKGDKIHLLFQGNTPAQSVHMVKNLEDSQISPWYHLKKDIEIPVSNYTFYSSKFVRFK